jgi:rhamnose transport system permease protein
MLALAQMLVILVRGIDLSITANLALCGMLAALFNRAFPGAGVLPVLLLTLLAGGLLGAFNGLLVWKLRLPPIVVTLGTMSIYRGVIFLLSRGAWVNENEMSRGFLAFPRTEFLGLTLLTWLALLLVAGFIVALRSSRLARDLYAAGGNPHAAEFSGIDAGRAQFIAYTICGAVAGVCGYLWVARFAVAYTDIALGFELSVIAACLIGGVSIAGGTGSAVGVLLGCLFIGIIRSSLPLVGISSFWQMFINGAVILVAVLLSARQRDVQRNILEART